MQSMAAIKGKSILVLLEGAKNAELVEDRKSYPSLRFLRVADDPPGINAMFSPRVYHVDVRSRFDYVQPFYEFGEEFVGVFSHG